MKKTIFLLLAFIFIGCSNNNFGNDYLPPSNTYELELIGKVNGYCFAISNFKDVGSFKIIMRNGNYQVFFYEDMKGCKEIHKYTGTYIMENAIAVFDNESKLTLDKDKRVHYRLFYKDTDFVYSERYFKERTFKATCPYLKKCGASNLDHSHEKDGSWYADAGYYYYEDTCGHVVPLPENIVDCIEIDNETFKIIASEGCYVSETYLTFYIPDSPQYYLDETTKEYYF